MIKLLIILDFLLANLTPFTLHLIIFGIPFLDDFYLYFVYMLFWGLLDFRYFLNMIVLYFLYRLDKYINKSIRNTPIIYMLKIILYYVIYILTFYLLSIAI